MPSRFRAERSEADPASTPSRIYSPSFFRDEDEFLAALLTGRSDAQAELVRRHYTRVTAVLYRLLGNDEELTDLVQEVFVRALTGVHRFRGPVGALEAWVVRIAVFSARGLIRKRMVRRRFFAQSSPAVEAAVPARLASEEQLEVLRHTYILFDKLPADERIVLALHMVDQMSIPQIADSCGVSASTVKRRLRRARKRFDALAMLDPVLRTVVREVES